VAATAGGLVAGIEAVVLAGTLCLAVAGLLYGVATARTLAFTLLDPRRPASPLAVIP
jgi:hypothetical protein